MTTATKITVHVGHQRDGYIFGLRPRSRVWLEEQYPAKERVSSVFIGLDEVHNIRQIPGTILAQVLSLLTGLSVEELNKLGGVSIYDPSTQQEIMNTAVAYV